MAPTRRTPFALLALGAAALLSSWDPVSAPLGLGVGLAAALLCLRARREAVERSRLLGAALALSVAAVLASGAVVAWAAIAARSQRGPPIVDEIPRSDRLEALDRAAKATRPARDAARKELDAVEPRR